MNRSLFIITALFSFGVFAYACGNRNHEKWNETDVMNATCNCLAVKDVSLSDEQNRAACDCWVNKVIELSPDPMNQSEIPLTTVMQFTEQCRSNVRSK